MSGYVRVVLAGAVTFPAAALVLLVPYMIYEYRRYGAIPAWKSFVAFSLLLYALCAYYLVILPLPESRDAFVAYAATPQLKPFSFVGDFAQAAQTCGLSLASPVTWRAFLSTPDVYMTLFNVLLTFPVGFYARYLYGARWWQAMLAGFLTSLFFELTQLSGLYGIYTHPYRLFDVDDLIVNTTGALVGYVCTLPACRLLPSIDDVNARARERGRSYPSVTRRALALGIDLVACAVLTWAMRRVAVAFGVALGADVLLGTKTLAMTLALVVCPLLACGATPGQRLLRMRVVREDGADAPRARVLARQTMLWWGLYLLPCWILRLFPGGSVDGIRIASLQAIVWGIWAAWAVSLLVRIVACGLRRHSLVLLNAWASGTRLMTLPQIEALRAE